jgi:hypothetical protein
MKKIVLLFIVGLVGLSACLKDDRFPLSDKNAILSFNISGQASASVIDIDSLSITIPFDSAADVSNKLPSGVRFNNLASISPDTTIAQDFTVPVHYKMTAENGDVADWVVNVTIQGSNPQLANSNFNDWYTVGSYQQPGTGSNSTIWDTANKPLGPLGDANTNPVLKSGDDYYASMESIPAPALVRLASGTIFTGVFTNGIPSVTDPRSNITFGTPYTGAPVSFSTDFQYTPGADYQDGDGNALPGNDSCDIYVLLQIVSASDPTDVQRVATAWFRSGDTVTDWNTVTTDFIYGQVSSPYFIQPISPETWAPAGAVANQITVVYASSALGDSFTGAIGSVLNIDNLVLNY